MPDAFTFDEGNNSIRKFSTRAQMYDWMIEAGHIILEGDDQPGFSQRVDRAIAKGSAKAQAAKARMED